MAKQWVKFLKDHEDGTGVYRAGQVCEVESTQNVANLVDKKIAQVVDEPAEKKKTPVRKPHEPK